MAFRKRMRRKRFSRRPMRKRRSFKTRGVRAQRIGYRW